MIPLKRHVYILAAAAALIAAAVYISCLYPAFAGNDSPETISASVNLWLEHAPGYPLHAMLGKIASLIPAGGNAFRINLLSVFLSSITAFLFVLIAGKSGGRGAAAVFCGSMVLVFSSTFWGQGIEAKGSIYILNILLMLIIVSCLDEVPGRKKILLLAFAFGLAVSNSYMSAAAFIPAVIYACIKNRKDMAPAALLFILGLTPYIYIFIRGQAQLPPRWTDASALSGFLFLVLRHGYPGLPGFNISEAFFQAAMALKGLYENFSFVIIFALPGAFYALGKKPRTFAALISCAVMNLILAVFFNSVPESAPWFIAIYLMPAYLITAVFITCGFVWAADILKGKKTALLIAAVPLALFLSNLSKNDASRDFLDYDLGENLIKTTGKGALYLSYGDYFGMPMHYMCFAAREKSAVQNCDISSLAYSFGIYDLYKLTGVKLQNNGEFKGAMEKISYGRDVFTNLYTGAAADYYIDPARWRPCGILMKYGEKEGRGDFLFGLYSYRGIFDGRSQLRDFELPVISIYPSAMARIYSFTKSGFERKKLLRHAGAFPGVDLKKYGFEKTP
jgi:hypothetical protein